MIKHTFTSKGIARFLADYSNSLKWKTNSRKKWKLNKKKLLHTVCSTQGLTSYTQPIVDNVDKKLVKIILNMYNPLNSTLKYKSNCPQLLLIKW